MAFVMAGPAAALFRVHAWKPSIHHLMRLPWSILLLGGSLALSGCASTTGPGTQADASLDSISSNGVATLDLPSPQASLAGGGTQRLVEQATLDLEAALQAAAAKSSAPVATAGPSVAPPATAAGIEPPAVAVAVSPAEAAAADEPTQAGDAPIVDVGLDALVGSAAAERADAASVSPGVATASAESFASTSDSVSRLQLPRVALCSRVDGFGRFRPMASNVFVAGRPVRMIVYVEVAGFRIREAKSGDPLVASAPASEQHTVDLSQSLRLYTDSDGTLVWQRPAQRAIETSLSKRRDFYLLQVIELPATLSVGRFNLKIVVSDATSGEQAEAVLPIVLVAEPAASRQ
jgi:hypothetical protein